jgi:LPXTG-site transpeptidase (sortase) family protein
VAIRSTAEALALLEEARELVDRFEPLAPIEGESSEQYGMRCSQRDLVDALRSGLIPDEEMPDAVEVLRRALHLHLALVPDSGEYDLPGVPQTGDQSPEAVGPWDPPPASLPPPGVPNPTSLPHRGDAAAADRANGRSGSVEAPLPVAQPTPQVPRGQARPLRPAPPPGFPPPPGVALLAQPEVSPAVGRGQQLSPEPGLSAAAVHTREPAGRTTATQTVATDSQNVTDAPIHTIRASLILNSLRVIGVELVLFLGFALLGTAVIQGQAQHTLEASPKSLHISAPVIGLDLVVVGGDSRRDLGRGPGLVPGSGQPGSALPIVIVGSRITNGGPFRHLGALRDADVVTLRVGPTSVPFEVVQVTTETTGGRFVDPGGPQRLYLVTSNPPYQDRNRLVVVAQATTSARTGAAHAGVNVVIPALRGSPMDLAIAICLLGIVAFGWSWRSICRAQMPRWARVGSWLPAVLGSYLFWRLLLGSFSRLL